MTRSRWLIAGALLLAAGAAWAMWGRTHSLGERPPGQRPTLALLTSLPLVFGESFSLSSGGSPALTRIEQRYNVVPIGVADAASLAGKRYLLMAHPRAQPASALVELDQWVRGGGRVLLIADPQLDWDSKRSLGDPFRPPPSFADTGLLAHWGIRLDGPVGDGPVLARVRDREIATFSPGRLSASSCAIAGDGLVARCRLGKGLATVIADADFLNVARDDVGRSGNLTFLIDELDRLETN